MNARPPAVQPSLNQLPVGVSARVLEIRGDRAVARRLLGLGLRVGSVISVVQHRNRGVVVACAGSRVALGESVAELLVTQPIE